jgi:hypothetical protein
MEGWTWKPRFDRFVSGLQDLLSFEAKHGHIDPPEDFVSRSGIKLLQWKRNKIAEKRRGELSLDRIKLLEQVPGWTWEPQTDRFRKPLEEVKRFQVRHGHLKVPAGFDHAAGVDLALWIKSRRRDHRLGLLSAEKIKALEDVPGWRWSS